MYNSVSSQHVADHLADLLPANSGGTKGDKVPLILANTLQARVPKYLAEPAQFKGSLLKQCEI